MADLLRRGVLDPSLAYAFMKKGRAASTGCKNEGQESEKGLGTDD